MSRLLTFAVLFAWIPAGGRSADTGRTQATVTQPVAAVSIQQPAGPANAAAPAAESRDLTVTVGKSLIVDSPVNIQRVSIANGDLAEALAVNPREVLINGKAPGETSVVVWQQGGHRIFYDLTVRQSSSKLESMQHQMEKEFGGAITLTFENDTAFLRGTAKDLTGAERAAAIALTLGKVVNLLNVAVPPVEQQILLKVRFANVDRSAKQELGVNLFSTGALNTPGGITTGQFSPPKVDADAGGAKVTVGDALNLFLFRHDINLGATIKALQSRGLLEILAEPNVLAINGKEASFVSGGEFPFPTVQGGGAAGAVTISWREFGVRIRFLPTVTPRGTIRLQVEPEVSSLDYANGTPFQGGFMPALSKRHVQTEVELENGQSFAIAGLLDNRVTESLSKIPGLGDIPLLGKIFQSRSRNKLNTELLVLITPELVRPIPQGQPLPDLERPQPFMKVPSDPVRTPGMDVTGPVPVKPVQETMPVEELKEQQKQGQAGQGTPMPNVQFVPVPMAAPSSQPANPGLSPAAPAAGGHK